MVEAVENDLNIILMSTYKVVRIIKQRMLLLFLCGVRFLALSTVLCASFMGYSRDIVYADLCLLQCYSFSFSSTSYVFCASQSLNSKDGGYCPLPCMLNTASCQSLSSQISAIFRYPRTYTAG